jgi:hypothetical protein
VGQYEQVSATGLRESWQRDGFVVVPAYLTLDEVTPARSELEMLFPATDDFHSNVDADRNARFRDEYGGITSFPFPSTELNLLAVHARLIELAEGLLETERLRVYSVEAWAKYTGAADYEQSHHRDYLNHSLLVPALGQPARQVEVFVYLCDVPLELGPPHFVSRQSTEAMPAIPNWYPRSDGCSDPEHPTWISTTGRPDLYDVEVGASGAAGTVVAYRIETFHRGTALVLPRAARYTIHVSFRTADADWITRRAWTDTANRGDWLNFVSAASPRQLELFGFPPPGHPYWTDETITGMAQRYPGLDLAPWRR